MEDKKYIFQCAKCKEWGLEASSLRLWEKEVLYDKPEGAMAEKEGEMVWCKLCFEKLV